MKLVRGAEKQNVNINLEISFALDVAGKVADCNLKIDIHRYNTEDIHVTMGMNEATDNGFAPLHLEINSGDHKSPAIKGADRYPSDDSELQRSFQHFHSIQP